jgi:hypothetical protein
VAACSDSPQPPASTTLNRRQYVYRPGVPYYRAVTRDDSREDVVIATADNYLDVADLAATAIEELGLDDAELQMSVDGEAWTIVEEDFTLESPDLGL